MWGGGGGGNGDTRKVGLDTKMSCERTKISVERQIMEMTKDDSMAANKEETQLRESSANGAMCRFVNMCSLPT